jgi:hypothetical protein
MMNDPLQVVLPFWNGHSYFQAVIIVPSFLDASVKTVILVATAV